MRLKRSLPAKIGFTEAAAVSSGTAALHLALLLLNVGPGDEIVTSTLTFAATANAITYVGATPVFIDSDRESWNMDPNLLADELAACARRGKLPKAVMTVDLYGQCADYAPIQEICSHYNIPIVEDAAEALGATYNGQAAGTFGTIGCFSFNGNKIITSSGGGMLASDRPDLVQTSSFPGHSGTRSRTALRTYAHWLQLSHEQFAGGGRSRTASGARRSRGTPPGELPILPGSFGRYAGNRIHARAFIDVDQRAG